MRLEHPLHATSSEKGTDPPRARADGNFPHLALAVSLAKVRITGLPRRKLAHCISVIKSNQPFSAAVLKDGSVDQYSTFRQGPHNVVCGVHRPISRPERSAP